MSDNARSLFELHEYPEIPLIRLFPGRNEGVDNHVVNPQYNGSVR